MKLKVSRPVVLLAMLGVLLVVVVIARRGESPIGADPRAAGARQATTTGSAKETPVADLRLDRLKAEDSELGPTIRNPFQFKAKPAPAPRAEASAPKAPVVVAPPPVPQGPPPPPPITLKFIGVLETAQGRVAIFRDAER